MMIMKLAAPGPACHVSAAAAADATSAGHCHGPGSFKLAERRGGRGRRPWLKRRRTAGAHRGPCSGRAAGRATGVRVTYHFRRFTPGIQEARLRRRWPDIRESTDHRSGLCMCVARGARRRRHGLGGGGGTQDLTVAAGGGKCLFLARYNEQKTKAG